MRRALFALLLPALVMGAMGACNGGVQHPAPGEPNDKEVCAKRPDGEMNCMACSAVPGCGWCGFPSQGGAQCQPGVSGEMPATCAGGWAQSSEECAKPPPADPPGAAPEEV